MLRILSASETQAIPKRRRQNAITWPIADLDIGQSFIIPMANGRDETGRREDNIRVQVIKKGQILNRRFSCRKVEDGLMVIRLA
jgi:hypothetical protein